MSGSERRCTAQPSSRSSLRLGHTDGRCRWSRPSNTRWRGLPMPELPMGTVEAGEVLDLLTGLVEKSMVLYEEQGGQGRYRLLETVRQYARDRLLEAGEAELMWER